MAQPPPAVLRLLTSAFAAVRHAAKSLASVTHAAYNHTVTVMAEDDTVTSEVIRDLVDKPRAKQKPKAVGLTPLPPPPPLTRAASCSVGAHQHRGQEERQQRQSARGKGRSNPGRAPAAEGARARC